MARKLLIAIGCFFVLALFMNSTVLGQAPEAAKADTTKKAAAGHQYVGFKKCVICHKKDGVGPSWEATAHAKAWESLKPEDQKKAECIGCHMTGKTAEGEVLTGVQCEACHGPGSDYKAQKTMQSRELAVAAGMVVPDEKTCLKCHNDKVPEQFRSKEPWDFAKMKAKGVHAKAVKAAPPAAGGK